MKTTALLILTLAATSVHAVSAPNTFVSGQPAIAADVNENFDVIATGVNDNTNAIAALTTGKSMRVVDGNGIDLGTFLNVEVFSGKFRYISDKGYIVPQLNQYGSIMPTINMYYETDNCSGQPYVQQAYPVPFVFDINVVDAQGMFQYPFPRKYISNQTVEIFALSRRFNINNQCEKIYDISQAQATPGLFYNVNMVIPNDPNVTGISDVSTPPFTPVYK